jgi:hypothetical protein
MVERRLHQFLEGASLAPGLCVFSATSGHAACLLHPSIPPSLHHFITSSLVFIEFRNRLVLNREIDRIRNIAKFVGPLVERFGLFG